MKRLLWPISFLMVFVLSGGLAAYAFWLFQIERGNQAFQRGDSKTATEFYEWAESPFIKFPWLALLLKSEYQKLFFNQVRLLYAKGQDGAVLERLEEGAMRAPFLSEDGEYSFWAGNILLRKALQSKDPEDLATGLKATLAEYHKGLVAQPDDWDLKYNYELVRYLLSAKVQGKKEGEEKAKSILEKMRPKVDPSQEALPPEKRG